MQTLIIHDSDNDNKIIHEHVSITSVIGVIPRVGEVVDTTIDDTYYSLIVHEVKHEYVKHGVIHHIYAH